MKYWKRFWEWVFGRGAEQVVKPLPKKPRTTKPRRPSKCLETGKLCRNEKAAKTRANQMKLRAYKCQFCGFWHLTHKKMNRKR